MTLLESFVSFQKKANMFIDEANKPDDEYQRSLKNIFSRPILNCKECESMCGPEELTHGYCTRCYDKI